MNFGTPGIADYRNPSIAECLKNLGFVQRFGMGIPLAHGELAKNGNPPAHYDVTDTHVLVTLRPRP
jgi:ATP-dependent DNA helicase RecG